MTDAVAAPPRRWIEPTTLGDLLDRRAEEHPERVALAFPDHEVTYGCLAARADVIARGLVALGVRRGEPVGILLPNCADSIAALFGAAKVGALPVPVNARFKHHELGQVIGHSGMRVLLTAEPAPGAPDFPALLRETFPDPASGPLEHVVVLDGGERDGFLSGEAFERAADGVDPAEIARLQRLVRVRDAALVMYTSGTTASPKGAIVSHEALTRVADGVTHERFHLTPEDRIWTALPLFHVGGLAFAITSLYAGCSYHHTGFFTPAAALDQLEAQRCTIALPGFETIWLPVVEQPGFEQRDLSALRIVMNVGVPERLRDFAARLPQAVQIACFGMTEASSFLSLNKLTDTLEERTETGGDPLPGMECRVIDPETGRDQPPGVEGELLFRGSNCFDGYLRDPELTAQVFDADGWFHTGDVATITADGKVTFVSRLKDMLKVGGENVSAVEVEGYLLTHPAIASAQVVAAPDARYVEVPAAFVQLKEGATASEQEIVDFCVGRIASFRVPRDVRFVTEWPMSGTKIKKYELREAIAAELAAAGVQQAPKVLSAVATASP